MQSKSITPYLFDGYLVIALHPDWIKQFNGIPSIRTKYENKQLHLILENDHNDN